MYKIWSVIYSFLLLPLFILLVNLAALKNRKIKQTLQGHNGLWHRLQTQLAARNAALPLLWFHAASVGEYLQVIPIIKRFIDSGYNCAVTLTSVSGYRWAIKEQTTVGLTAVEYMPFDTKSNMRRLMDMLQPSAIVYAKYDLWPNMVWQAALRKIPQFLVSASLQEDSKRYNNVFGRSLNSTLYECMHGIFTVSDMDTGRFIKSNPKLKSIATLGSTAYDSVLNRKLAENQMFIPLQLKKNIVFIMGSIWPSDERILFPVLKKALYLHRNLVLIIAPHEIDEKHIEQLQQEFMDYSPLMFSQLQNQQLLSGRIIIVNQIGQLAGLYRFASFAYVGGGFGIGVHSVVEPAVMNLASIVGPNYNNSNEAINLVNNELCFPVRTEQEFAAIFNKLLSNENYRQRLQHETELFVQQQIGASDRCFDQISRCISQ